MTTSTFGRRPAANEHGIALVLSLFLMMAMSIVAASLMFLSQTETYSSMNYRLMSQARYGAEAGIQKAGNFLMFTSTYTPPSTGGADSIASYNTTVSPVTYNGNPVTLAPVAANSNYPVASVATAYATAVGTSLAAGTTSITYAPTATLLSMEEVPASQSLSGAAFTIQTWQITSDGTIAAGTRNATVEVTATVDTQKIGTNSPAFNYAAFATSGACGAITFSGNSSTQSYDSSTYSGSGNVTASNGGLISDGTANANVGTNGNLTNSGNSTINGTLSTPRVGVGNCSSGNVDANTSSGHASVTGGIIQLPSAVTAATPVVAVPTIPTSSSSITITGGSTCASIVAYVPAANCTQNGVGNLTFHSTGTTLALPNITVSNGTLSVSNGSYTMGAVSLTSNGSLTLGDGSNTANSMAMTSLSGTGNGALTIEGGNYAMNSFSLSGGVTSATNVTGGQVTMTVVNSFQLTGNSTLTLPSGGSSKMQLNVVSTATGTPVDMSGGSLANQTMDPSKFLVEYGGTGGIHLSGNGTQSAVIYAPNAAVAFTGNAGLYGEIIGATVTNAGNGSIYYDRNLAKKGLFAATLYQPGNPLMSAFSWKKQ